MITPSQLTVENLSDSFSCVLGTPVFQNVYGACRLAQLSKDSSREGLTDNLSCVLGTHG